MRTDICMPARRRAALAAAALALMAAASSPAGAFELVATEPAGSVLHGCVVKVPSGETVVVRLEGGPSLSGAGAGEATVTVAGPGTAAAPLRETVRPGAPAIHRWTGPVPSTRAPDGAPGADSYALAASLAGEPLPVFGCETGQAERRAAARFGFGAAASPVVTVRVTLD